MNLRSVGSPSLGWLLLGALAAAVGWITYAAGGSVTAERYPLQQAGFAVAAGSLALAVLVPVAISTGIARNLRARGRNVSTSTVAAASVALLNLILVVGIQMLSPLSVKTLWLERGTWVFDAMTAQGPYGPPALPVVKDKLEQLREANKLASAAPLWCEEASAGFAVGLAAGLRDNAPLPLAQALGSVLDRYGVTSPEVVPEGLDGRAMLADVMDLAVAAGPAVDLPPQGPPDGTPTLVERKRIVGTTTGWEARYEDGEWRWCPGTGAEALVRGRAHAIAIRAEAERVPTPTVGSAAGADDAEVRLALQKAVRGRAAWLSGVAALDPAWSESLTQPAAAIQGERLRTWCTAQAKEDAARMTAIGSVAQRWTLPAPGAAVDPAVQALLDAQGRRYLHDVVEACAPVLGDRQVREAAKGLTISETQRARWADLEARAVASSAVLTPVGEVGSGEISIAVDGGTLRAVKEEGTWRIDLR
jgi:hypothetical protein